jgi:iron-sulfur cluster assembly protein
MEESYAGCDVSIYNVSKPYEVVVCELSLTEQAAIILKSLADEDETVFDDKWYLYINVMGGGCSGYLYDVQILDQHPPSNTQVLISQGIEIVINVQDSTLLHGIEIDWDDSLMGGGLKFKNPNATKTCSCGISFKG